jgi:hypothetical protein
LECVAVRARNEPRPGLRAATIPAADPKSNAAGQSGALRAICRAVNRPRPRCGRAALSLLGACALWSLGHAPARAYEDQLSLGVSLGYAHAVSDAASASPPHGALAALDTTLGLDDIWTLRAQFGFGWHPAPAPMSVFLASTELLYMVDVLEIVPYFGAGVDGLGRLRSAALEIELGVHPVLGLDWLPQRELVLGIALRPVFLVSALDHDPVYLTISASASLLFDL